MVNPLPLELVERTIEVVHEKCVQVKSGVWKKKLTLNCGHDQLVALDGTIWKLGNQCFCDRCQQEQERLYQVFKARLLDDIRKVIHSSQVL